MLLVASCVTALWVLALSSTPDRALRQIAYLYLGCLVLLAGGRLSMARLVGMAGIPFFAPRAQRPTRAKAQHAFVLRPPEPERGGARRLSINTPMPMPGTPPPTWAAGAICIIFND